MEKKNSKLDLIAYATSATVLYGIVTIEEFCEIVRYWHPRAKLNPSDVRDLLLRQQERHPDETYYCVRGNYLCDYSFDSGEIDIEDWAHSLFSQREDKTRWVPKTEKEFLSYVHYDDLILTPERKMLSQFLRTHGISNAARVNRFLRQIAYRHFYGEPMKDSIEVLTSCLKIDTPEDAMKFSQLFSTFLNTMRLPVNYGWTPQELKLGITTKECRGHTQSSPQSDNERLAIYRPWRTRVSEFIRRFVTPRVTEKLCFAAGERLGFIKDGKPVKELSETEVIVICDYAAMLDDQFGLPPIQQMVANSSQFRDKRLETLEFISQYRYTWLEILDAVPCVGCTCRDLLTGEKGFLMEVSFSQCPDIRGMVCCGGIGILPNGTWMFLDAMHPGHFDNPELVLKIVLSHLGLPSDRPIQLSFADQARFAAETIRRISANGHFDGFIYGGPRP